MRLVMGEAPKTWPHLPSLDGRPVGPAAHLSSFAAGFEEAHELLSTHAEELTSEGGLLGRCLGLRTRVIARPTNLYKALLRESVEPVHLTDVAGRNRCFEGLVPEEIESLERFDVPLFKHVAGESELASARAALGGSSANERAWQVSVLRGAALASAACPIVGATKLPLGRPISRAWLLEEAEAVRRRLDEAAHREPDGSLAWMGFQSLPGAELFRFGPLGEDFADGGGGVALFHAALDLARGIEGGREALERAVAPLSRVLASTAHALPRRHLLDDHAALDTALAAPLPAGDSLCCGLAGRLDLELEAARILGRPLDGVYVLAASWLERAATRGGYELLSNVPPGHVLPGLLHGWSGIGFALARLAAPGRVPSLFPLDGPAE